MACADRNAVQSHANRRCAAIEFRVVHSRSNHVFGGVAGHGARYEISYQKTRDRRVAIGKMQLERAARVFVARWGETHAPDRALRQFHAVKSGQPDSPTVE